MFSLFTRIIKITRILVFIAMLAPSLGLSQAMMVLGGGQKAEECYMNAEIAAQNLAGLSFNLLKPCNYTLEYSNLNLRDRAATFANRGIVHAAMKHYDKALADYKTAMSLNPSAPEFYLNRGNSFFMMQDYGMAMDDYEKSLELGITQIHYLRYNMGMAYERLGNDMAAQEQYLLAMEFDPNWKMAGERLVIVRQRMAEDAAASALSQ